MDKVFSARVDESTVARIEVLARKLGKTKKQIVEEAIDQYGERVGAGRSTDILEQTCGAWKRPGSAGETVEKARKAFRDSMTRARR
ncbi:MAG: CopG family transcriptional regulator [Planctomycetes bacterium]|nr:CopG family transcriptional regulator [Planctomycetota bacterium]